MKFRITILKYHSCYLCQISLQIMLLPILIPLLFFFNFIKCPTPLILQNRQGCFCFWTKGNKWCQSVFCIHFLDLKNKQKSAKIIKAMCTTQKQAHIIFPQIKHLSSNKHPPPSKHPPLRPRPIQISTPPVSPAHHFLKW